MKCFYYLPAVSLFVLTVLHSAAQTTGGLAAQDAMGTVQITPRNLLQPYTSQLSQSLLSGEGWKPFPQSPEGWATLLPDSVRRKIIKAGEAGLTYEFREIPMSLILDYMHTGTRVHYEALSFGKRGTLWDLVLAESVEGKGRFTGKILEGVWSICEETYWGSVAHLFLQKAGPGLPDVEDPTVDLFTAETAAVLAWADYFAGPVLEKLSPLIRPRIYYEVNRHVFAPMAGQKYGYLGGGRDDVKLNNWAPWVMSNYLTAVLLLEKDGARRMEGVQRAMHYTDQYINGLGEDGGCEEGPTYWTEGGACVFDILNLLHDATGGKINIYRQPIIQRMGAYIYKMHIAGKYYVNIADAAPEFVPDGLLIYRFGEVMGDAMMSGFGSWVVRTYPVGVSYEQFHRTRTLYDLAAWSACVSAPPLDAMVKDVWLENVQVMTARNDKGLFVAAHGGNNGESHNHNDVGDFMVYAGGKPVIIDVGPGTYTARTFSRGRYDLWFNTSPYHNLPVINGQQQPEGLQYAATAVSYKRDRKSSSLTMDIGKAYPMAAGIQSWVREVSMAAGGVTVTDRYAMKTVLQSLTQSFMTVCMADISKPGVVVFETEDHKKVSLYYDPTVWGATLEKVELGIPEEAGVRQHWDNRPVYRVLMTAKVLAARGSLTWKIPNQ